MCCGGCGVVWCGDVFKKNVVPYLTAWRVEGQVLQSLQDTVIHRGASALAYLDQFFLYMCPSPFPNQR